MKSFRKFLLMQRLGRPGSLRLRLQAAIAAIMLLAAGVTSIGILLFVSDSENEAWQSRQHETAENVARTTDYFLEGIYEVMHLIGEMDIAYLQTDTSIVLRILEEHPALLEMIRLDREAQILVDAYKQDTPILVNTFTLPQSNWFLQARQGLEYEGELQISANDEPYIILSVPVDDGGVVASHLNMVFLWNMVKGAQIGMEGQVYLADSYGTVIGHADPDVLATRPQITDPPELLAALNVAGQDWSGRYTNFQGRHVLGTISWLTHADWIVFVEVPIHEAQARTRLALSVLAASMLILGGVISLTTNYMLTRLVFDPVDSLRSGSERLGQGDLDYRLTLHGPDEITQVATAFNQMAQQLGEREQALAEARERLQDAFSRYVAPELAQEVMEHGAALSGKTVRASILFADIRGFTALAEHMEPAAVVDLLNQYFSVVEPVIRGENGWINKFGGDSLLAIFGAPTPQHDHELRAVRAALGLRHALAKFNARQEKQGLPVLHIGIGVHCGEVVAGSMGSAARMEYTVVGDVVNLAARIQGLCRDLGVDILLSEEIYNRAGKLYAAFAMPPMRVRGKDEPVQVYWLQNAIANH